MVGQQLPPIIISNGKVLDGRHRIFAAKKEGKHSIRAIDLSRYNLS
jgi:ParB-like chromosome segregation protein Spo0J